MTALLYGAVLACGDPVALAQSPVSAPAQVPSPTPVPTTVELSITGSGTCSVNGHVLACSDISRYLSTLDFKDGCALKLRADPHATYGDVAVALKSLQKFGRCALGTVNVNQ